MNEAADRIEAIARENERLREALQEIASLTIPEGSVCQGIALAALAGALSSVARENERLREALEEIKRWAAAYPLKVFPEPDLKAAHEALQKTGITLDAISASAMRHVLKGVMEIVVAALTPQENTRRLGAPAATGASPAGRSGAAMSKVCVSRRTAQYILDSVKSSGVATNWDRDDAIADLEVALSSPPSIEDMEEADPLRQARPAATRQRGESAASEQEGAAK